MSRLLYGDESFLRREELGDGVYRVPSVVGVSPGETVKDGWSQPHTAPTDGKGWELWEVVAPDNTLLHFEWRAEEAPA